MAKEDFQGKDRITLKPNDFEVPYEFEFTRNSADGADDGALPAGCTITGISVAIREYREDTPMTTPMVANTDRDDNILTVDLNYPTGYDKGNYRATFIVSLTGTPPTKEFDFLRIDVVD